MVTVERHGIALATYWTVLALAFAFSAFIVWAVHIFTYAPFPWVILQMVAVVCPGAGLLSRSWAIRRWGRAKAHLTLSAAMCTVIAVWLLASTYLYFAVYVPVQLR